jgi:hypothetical protein
MKVTVELWKGENRLIVLHRKKPIGDATQAPDGTWEALHYASDLSWDGIDGVCSAIEQVCDAHAEYVAEKKKKGKKK